MRGVKRFVVLGSMVVLGCSAAPPPASSPGSTESTETPVAPARTTSEPSESASPAPSSIRPIDEAELASPVSPFQLVLPWDETFSNAELPEFNPGRYSSWRESARLSVGQSHLTQVDLLPNGELLAMSDDEGAVRRYDRASKRLLGRVKVPGFERFEPTAVVAWPSAEPRFLTGSGRGILLFDARSDASFTPLDEHPVHGLRWSADAQVLVAVGQWPREQTSVLHFFARSSESLTRLGSLSFEERVDAWDLSRDNRLLALVHYPSNSVRVLDLHSGGEILRIPAPRYAGDIAFSPDGRLLAVGGDGLLLVDLLNPDRRAFHSYVKNNIGHVRFSPSGDAVFASSYDGRIRIFGVDGPGQRGLTLQYLHELRHTGQANVYAFVFTGDGRSVISVSGDQTIRIFSERGSTTPTTGPASTRRFHDLETWQHLDPEAAKPLPPPPRVHIESGHYFPPAFTAPPRPSRIAPGLYACKITAIYKLRDCRVEQDAAGRTFLTFAPDNLLSLTGVLYDDGPVVRYEATLLERPSVIDCAGCERQPLLGVLRGSGKRYEGLLTFRTYHDPFVPPPEPPANVTLEEANDRFPIVLEWRGPLPTQSLERAK